MKHCPNLACPFIDQTGFISEFRDEVTVCPDCEANLVDGPAPPVPERVPAVLGTEPLTWQSGDVVWTVASYSQEEEALADLDTLAEEGIEAVVTPEELPDENGTLAPLYHLQVMPIDRFVAQTALGLDDDESQVDEEYWANLQEEGHFEVDDEADDDLFWEQDDDQDWVELDEEYAETQNGLSPLVVIIAVIVVLSLLFSMTRVYQLF